MPITRRSWVIASTAVLVVLSIVLILFRSSPRAADRTITAPSAEEYAVWSAFLDDFFHGNGSSVVSCDTLQMQNPGAVLPLDVAALVPDEIGNEFFRRSAKSWHLQPCFRPPSQGVTNEHTQDHSHIAFSRIGFNQNETMGLLYYAYYCGPLCGQSGLVVLRKSGEYWHISEFGKRLVY